MEHIPQQTPQLAWNVPEDALIYPESYGWLICPRCDTVQAHKPPMGASNRAHYDALQCPRCKCFGSKLLECSPASRARAFQHRADNPPPAPGKRGEGKAAYAPRKSFEPRGKAATESPAYSRPLETNPFAGRAFYFCYQYPTAGGLVMGDMACKDRHPVSCFSDIIQQAIQPITGPVVIVSMCEMKPGDFEAIRPVMDKGKTIYNA